MKSYHRWCAYAPRLLGHVKPVFANPLLLNLGLQRESVILGTKPLEIQKRYFHSSQLLLAKGKKGGKGGKAADDSVEAVSVPDIKKISTDMDDKIARLNEEFSRIRSGRANADMFRDVKVDAFGSKVSLAEVGQMSFPSPTKMQVTPYESSLANAGAFD